MEKKYRFRFYNASWTDAWTPPRQFMALNMWLREWYRSQDRQRHISPNELKIIEIMEADYAEEEPVGSP